MGFCHPPCLQSLSLMNLSRLFKFQEILLLLRASQTTSKVCVLLVLTTVKQTRLTLGKVAMASFLSLILSLIWTCLCMHQTPEDLNEALVQVNRYNTVTPTCTSVCNSLKVIYMPSYTYYWYGNLAHAYLVLLVYLSFSKKGYIFGNISVY